MSGMKAAEVDAALDHVKITMMMRLVLNPSPLKSYDEVGLKHLLGHICVPTCLSTTLIQEFVSDI